MQPSLEARQRVHERYERQSVSQRQLAEDFQVSLSTVKRILKRSKDDLGRRAGSGNPGKVHERERLCIAEYAQQCPMLFCASMSTKSRGNAGCASRSKRSACTSENSNGRSKKQTHLSGIPLGALAATVAALYRVVDPIAEGTRGRVPLGRRNGCLR